MSQNLQNTFIGVSIALLSVTTAFEICDRIRCYVDKHSQSDSVEKYKPSILTVDDITGKIENGKRVYSFDGTFVVAEREGKIGDISTIMYWSSDKFSSEGFTKVYSRKFSQ